MHSFKIRFRGRDCVMATWGPFLIVSWIGDQSDVATIRTIHKLSSELSRAHPAAIAHLNLVDLNLSGGLNEESRKGIIELLRDRSIPLVGAAIVMPGSGFLSALVRSALTGAVLLARSAAKIRFVPTVHDAETFLRDLDSHTRVLGLDAGALVRTVDMFRRECRVAA
jgi:hypothetical protein